MTLLDLLNKIDEKENVQIHFSTLKTCENMKKEMSPAILDREVKAIWLDGCTTFSVEIG